MFYGVSKGKEVGVFETWDECQQSVLGFSGALYKKFKTYAEAYEYAYGVLPENNEAVERAYNEYVVNNKEVKPRFEFYIDGDYDDIIETASYGLVFLDNGRVVCRDFMTFNDDRYLDYLDKYGLYMGVIRATQLALANGVKKMTIYYSYEGVAGLVNGAWKPNSELTEYYASYMKIMEDNLDISFVELEKNCTVAYPSIASKLAKEALKY